MRDKNLFFSIQSYALIFSFLFFQFVSIAQVKLPILRTIEFTAKNELKLNYTVVDTSYKGFFIINESFSEQVKMISKSKKCHAELKENQLHVTSERLDYGIVFSVELKFSSSKMIVDGQLILENYPDSSLIFSLEKIIWQKQEDLANSEIIPVISRHDTGSCMYRVQIAAAKSKMNLSQLKLQAGNQYEVAEDFIDGFYKYTVGNFYELKKAEDLQRELSQKAFKKPFIVAYKNGVRVKIKQHCAEN